MRTPVRAALASLSAAWLMASGFGAGYALRPDRFAQSGLSCPAAARPFARLELLFGTQRKDAAPVSEEEWSQFLAAEITPRFPEGLTVFTGQGQWRGQDGINIKETSRMLLVWHSNEDDASSRIEAIRAAYKNRFGQESVLRADGESCVSF